MNLGGWQKISLMDYPDKIATVVFTNGCVFRCGFCYNKGLVIPPYAQQIQEQDFFDFLKNRQGRIQAVVITGGEPCLQPDIEDFMRRIKELGYLIKLDSNGYLPTILDRLIKSGLIDYIAMDIKAPLDKYSLITGVWIDPDKISTSIKLIINSGIAHEFRSTLIKEFHSAQDLTAMAKLIQGADKYFLQSFKPAASVIDPQYKTKTPFSRPAMAKLAKQCQKYINTCEARPTFGED